MRSVALPSLLFVIAAVGCSAAGSHNGFTEGTGAPNSGGQGGAGAGGDDSSGVGGSFSSGVGVTSGSSSGSGAGGGCLAAATLVYVLSTDNQIYSFEPDKKQFTPVSMLNCDTTGATSPNSMAVDRNAVAWINYTASDDSIGRIYKFDLINKGGCQLTSISLPSGWTRLGMGFSTDSANGESETLYVAGTGTTGFNNSPGVGKIDFTKNAVVPIGQFSGNLKGQSAELTGTGDAKLYGFFTTTPVRVAEITKDTGATPSPQKPAGVETPSAWAFSFWGGDFYLYTAPDPFSDPSRTTNVTKYTLGGASDPMYMTDIGFTIVGAGVSTCAPLTTPK